MFFQTILQVLVRKNHLSLIYVENYLFLLVIVAVVRLIVKNNLPNKLMIFMGFVENWYKLCLNLKIRFKKSKEKKVKWNSKVEIWQEILLNRKFNQD